MRAWPAIAAMVALFALASCGDAGFGNQQSNSGGPISALQPKLEGWEDYKFGMSFDDAFVASSAIRWDGKSFMDCRDEIPVRGCSLSPDQERSFAPSTAGMALLPRLDFNQEGVLTDIALERKFEAGVTPKQCEEIHSRLVDHLAAKYGRPTFDPKDEGAPRKTAAGNTWHRSKGLEGIFVAGIEIFRTYANGARVRLMTVYMPGSEYTAANCHPSVLLDGPKALKRRVIDTRELDAALAEKPAKDAAEDEEVADTSVGADNQVLDDDTE